MELLQACLLYTSGISGTEVVCVRHKGAKGRYYLLIIPAFIVLGLLIYWGVDIYQDYESDQYSKKCFTTKIDAIKKGLENISTSTIIQIEEMNNRYSGEDLFLKVEEMQSDELLVALIRKKSDYSKSMYSVEQLYKATGNSLQYFTIKRSLLDKAYTTDYAKYRRDEFCYADLLSDGRKFQIVRIENLFCPIICDRGTGSFGEQLTISFENYGWPAMITEIQAVEGTVNWSHYLPAAAPNISSGSFSLSGDGYSQGSTYKFKMIVVDSLNHKQTYLVEGRNTEKTVERIE